MIYLTFDCEDFINVRSMLALHRILELLQKYDVKGLFFLTGHMAEKIRNFPKILDLLENHEIGYHSSAHSVHPTIVEYTDVMTIFKKPMHPYTRALLDSIPRIDVSNQILQSILW